MDALTVVLFAVLTVLVGIMIGVLLYVVRLQKQLAAGPSTETQQSIKMFGEINQTLGELSAATKQVQAVGEEIAELQDVLSVPHLRGALGEQLLEDLLSQMLPDKNFSMQHHLKDGQIVDAAIHLSRGHVPVDCKFPLDSFKRLMDTDDDGRSKARREFGKACKGHVDDIAKKYIRPEENGFDFAMMYIPAENVYYEVILRDDSGSFANYALSKRVIPVSPNSFYAYLSVIVMGLRGMRIEQHAYEIRNMLKQMENDVSAISGEYQTLGRHIRHANNKWESLDHQIKDFERRFEALDKPTLPEGGEKTDLLPSNS